MRLKQHVAYTMHNIILGTIEVLSMNGKNTMHNIMLETIEVLSMNGKDKVSAK
jgi:hypothetical protein